MYWILANFFFSLFESQKSPLQTLTNCSLLPRNSREHKETKEIQFVLGTSRAEQPIIIDPSPPLRKHKHSAVQRKHPPLIAHPSYALLCSF